MMSGGKRLITDYEKDVHNGNFEFLIITYTILDDQMSSLFFSKVGLDFDYESDKIPTSGDASTYETCYVTSHKAPCRAAAFDRLGTVIATGSVDASIKLLDIERFYILFKFMYI